MTKRLIYHGFFIVYMIEIFIKIVEIVFFEKDYSSKDLHTTIMNLYIFIFWVWNIVIWAKRDKNIFRFLALIFLNGLYLFIYYPKVVNNNTSFKT
jgi:hypothetical protein